MSRRVLVIDDEDDIREVAQVSLEILAGLEVIPARSGHEGITKAQEEQPDAILLDVMLPDMDGIAIFERLQANPATRHIPVILLTARTQVADQQRFADLGIRAVINKPFKPAKLADQVLEILGWNR